MQTMLMSFASQIYNNKNAAQLLTSCCLVLETIEGALNRDLLLVFRSFCMSTFKTITIRYYINFFICMRTHC